jgi:hypothetical protein
MILVLIIIESLIIFRFMMLKSNFSVKRNLLKKAFGYSRGSHRSSREFNSYNIKESYDTTTWECCKQLLLQKKAHIREILAPCECCALLMSAYR